MGFPRQEYWVGVSFPTPGESSQPRDPTLISCLLLWQVDSLPTAPPGKLVKKVKTVLSFQASQNQAASWIWPRGPGLPPWCPMTNIRLSGFLPPSGEGISTLQEEEAAWARPCPRTARAWSRSFHRTAPDRPTAGARASGAGLLAHPRISSFEPRPVPSRH